MEELGSGLELQDPGRRCLLIAQPDPGAATPGTGPPCLRRKDPRCSATTTAVFRSSNRPPSHPRRGHPSPGAIHGWPWPLGVSRPCSALHSSRLRVPPRRTKSTEMPSFCSCVRRNVPVPGQRGPGRLHRRNRPFPAISSAATTATRLRTPCPGRVRSETARRESSADLRNGAAAFRASGSAGFRRLMAPGAAFA